MGVLLEKAITDLRTQLQNAALAGADAALRFVPESVEVELSVEITKEAEATVSGSLWSIVSLSGKAKASSENTHKVKLTLKPVDSSGEAVLISSSLVQD